MESQYARIYRFVVDDSISPLIAEHLISKGSAVYKTSSFFKDPENTRLPKLPPHTVFLTANGESMKATLASLNIPFKICKIILQDPPGTVHSERGDLILSILDYVSVSGKKKLSGLSIEIGTTIKIRRSIDKALVTEEYNSEKVKRGYFLKKTDTKYDTTFYKEQLLERGQKRKGYLAYDDIYKILPDSLAYANVVEDIVAFLKAHGIEVFSTAYNRKKGERDLLSLKLSNVAGPTKQELQELEKDLEQMEIDVEQSLKALLAGAFEPEDDQEESVATEVQSEIVDGVRPSVNLHAKIPLPNVPHLSSVTPGLADGSSLLVSRDKTKQKRTASSKTRQNAGAIVDDLMNNAITGDHDETTVPKLYDTPKFNNDRRLSLYAGMVGRRAEEIVIKLLQETLSEDERKSIRWISRMGETPGWDIDYIDSDGQIIGIEVKGTTGKSFPNVEITCNEWDAAFELQDRYWLYLVTSCFSGTPKVQRINNPSELNNKGEIKVTPLLWKLERILAGQSEE